MDISLSDFLHAEEILKPIIHRTETMHSTYFSNMIGGRAFLKCENLQKTASFKIRGATYAIARKMEEEKIHSVITASAGNHAQGVAYAARKMGLQATIVMPENTPLMKINATEGYGARVVLSGTCFDEAYAEALKLYALGDSCFVHPYDDPDVITGQGTVGVEILQDHPDADVILVPAGGGGLLAGVATAAKKMNPHVEIIGVQSEKSNALVCSFRQKKLVMTGSSETIADGIAVRNPGKKTLELIWQNVDDMVEVSDSDIDSAILTMVERTKLIVEPAGAASVAALMRYKDRFAGKKVVCVLSGGNIDTWKMHRYLELALLKAERWVHFKVMFKARHGSMPVLTRTIVTENGATIMDIALDRYSATDADEIACRFTCEVRDAEHKKRLIAALREKYKVEVIE